MGMSQSQPQTRESIEAQIEACKETIYEHKYALRWYTLGKYICFIGLFCCAILVTIPLSACQTIGGIGFVVVAILGIGLGATHLEGTYRSFIIDHQRASREAKKTLTKLLRNLAQYDERINNQLPSLEQHAERLPRLIATYRKQANRYRQWFIVTQIIIILLSATVTSLSGGWIDRYILLPWAIPVLSALISILTSFTLFFKFREKGANLQETADQMDLEFKACGLGIEPYNGMKKEDALLLLAKRTETLRKDQLQRQQQLEQSSQNEQRVMQTEK